MAHHAVYTLGLNKSISKLLRVYRLSRSPPEISLLAPDDSDKIRLCEETIFECGHQRETAQKERSDRVRAAPMEHCSNDLSHNTCSRICNGALLHYRPLQIGEIDVELFNELLSVFIREPFPCPLEVLKLLKVRRVGDPLSFVSHHRM